jgi:hypothetical protein
MIKKYRKDIIPHHRKLLGYKGHSAPKNHPEYLVGKGILSSDFLVGENEFRKIYPIYPQRMGYAVLNQYLKFYVR